MTRGASGDGWVVCERSHRHWGRYGAAGLLLVAQERLLLAHRIFWSHHGNTWGIPGGARDERESAVETALRETAEETGLDPDLVGGRLVVGNVSTDDHGGWSYATVHAALDEPVPLSPQDGEASELRWVPLAEVGDLDLHPGFAAFWRERLAWSRGPGSP